MLHEKILDSHREGVIKISENQKLGVTKFMQALFTLTSSESKGCWGKAVAAMPEVQHAKNNGYLVVGPGSTNASSWKSCWAAKWTRSTVAGR